MRYKNKPPPITQLIREVYLLANLVAAKIAIVSEFGKSPVPTLPIPSYRSFRISDILRLLTTTQFSNSSSYLRHCNDIIYFPVGLLLLAIEVILSCEMK